MKQAKGDKKRCDDLLREILKLKYKQCLKCGSGQNLQVSHIISRRFSATRCDISNVQLLCAKDHIYFTNWPREFSKWISQSIGSDKYEELRLKALSNTGYKIDWKEECDRLTKIKTEYVSYREGLFV